MSDMVDSAQQLPAGRGLPSPATRWPGSPASAPLVRRKAWIRRLPLLPALVYMIVVTQAPFVVTLWYSLRSWNTLTPGSNKFVGFDEYKLVFADPVFRAAVVNTVVMTASAVVISMLLAI